MKMYIQYFIKNNNGLIIEAMASDGYSPLDGRLSVETILNNPEKYIHNFKGYELLEIRKCYGDNPFTNYRTIYSNVAKLKFTYEDITKVWTKVCYYYSNFNKWAKETYSINTKQLNMLKNGDLEYIER